MRSFLLLAFVVPALALADDWSQFRGPNGTGISKATGLPTEWSEKKNIAWKRPLTGKGWSSPVVLGKQLWMTNATDDGKELFAVCLDLDKGTIIHNIKVFENKKIPYTFIEGYNSHASPTPVVEKGRVYVHFGSSGTACLNAENGKILWQRRDLPCDHWRGPASSPILSKDYLFVNFDGHDAQYVVALKKSNGKTVWKKDRTIDYKTDNGDLKKAYSTCSLIAVDGKPQLVSTGAGGTEAYDPTSGKHLWKADYGGMNAASPPLYGFGKVYVTSGYLGKLVAIKPTGSGDVSKTHIEWVYNKNVPGRSSPILVGDLIYMVSDTGQASCIDPKNHKEIWTKRLGGNFSASPICADGHLYFFDQDNGKGFAMKTGKEAKIVATNKLDAGCRATPAIAGKAMFVRTLKAVYRIEKK